MQNIERYSKIDLPAYKYIPKQGIHPSKLPEKPHIPAFIEYMEPFSSQSWQNNLHYLYAIDLFNYGYYWEVHEILEKLWMSVGKKSPEGIFLQGIIQLSVAMIKNLQSNANGTNRLIEKAKPKLLSQSSIYLGIDADGLIKQAESFLQNQQENPPLINLYLTK